MSDFIGRSHVSEVGGTRIDMLDAKNRQAKYMTMGINSYSFIALHTNYVYSMQPYVLASYFIKAKSKPYILIILFTALRYRVCFSLHIFSLAILKKCSHTYCLCHAGSLYVVHDNTHLLK